MQTEGILRQRSAFSLISKFHTGDNVLRGGWTISKVEGPVDIQIRHLDGRTKLTHIDRLQHHFQRNDQAILVHQLNMKASIR